MTQDEVLNEFRAAGALLEGHFVLSSGRHSGQYLQCARVMMEPARGERLCRALARKVMRELNTPIDLVVSPAMGGVIVGYETARHVECPAIFYERVDGAFTLRRGFEIPRGAHCLMVEDIVTTGLSSRECIAAIDADGGHVVGAACLIDRSGGAADVGVPLVALATLAIETYAPDEVPAALAAIPVSAPGSRHLSGG
ncbi:MAG TPA: orotate phosphoribosyltransferase [Thermopetrobacter sp.]|nr:orotate phosphoribosyltransferase [Thermopetrobacter sp.]